MELLLSRTHLHGKNKSAQSAYYTDHFEKENCLVVCGGRGALRDEAKEQTKLRNEPHEWLHTQIRI